jgi:hypothetical protein
MLIYGGASDKGHSNLSAKDAYSYHMLIYGGASDKGHSNLSAKDAYSNVQWSL